MSHDQLQAADVLIAVWGLLFALAFAVLLLVVFLGEPILNAFFWWL
jgi:hypothetical protein